MPIQKTPFNNVDQYIGMFPESTQKLLKQLRATIKKAAPKAIELISYQMPAYKHHGMLVFFAAYKNHIGLYPVPRTHELFKKDLAGYKGGKGTVQLPLDKPLPLKLITKIVKFRVMANEEKKNLKR